MNQILYNKNSDNKITKSRKYKKIYYTFTLFISLLIIALCLYLGAVNLIQNNNNYKLSAQFIDNYNISKLYSKSQNYVLSKDSTNEKTFSVIGIVKIDKIKISYPILSDMNDDLLQISPCYFYGPSPNQIGNMCIAAHNYNDNRFFGRINKLENGDIIQIFDQSRHTSKLLRI